MHDISSKKILVAPLDWGLGHATRCIPIINEFLKRGCEVQIATSNDALALLKDEFPDLKFHRITSYQAKYSSFLPLMVKILLQIPRLLRTIKKEHQETEEIIKEQKIDLVISDNRYGCWSKQVKSIFVGHQLNFKIKVFSSLIRFFHGKAVQRFSSCWVPDEEGSSSLAGELTINRKLKTRYIGILSRMKWQAAPLRYEILAIISGPEPQRTAFEKIILNELKDSNRKCLVVRGQPGTKERVRVEGVETISHLNAEDMNNAVLESELIISRSGYSTIMDLAALGKKAIFIPTPGQIEQQYLADRLTQKKIAFSMRQDKFNLQKALNYAKEYSGFERRNENIELTKAVEQILDENN